MSKSPNPTTARADQALEHAVTDLLCAKADTTRVPAEAVDRGVAAVLQDESKLLRLARADPCSADRPDGDLAASARMVTLADLADQTRRHNEAHAKRRAAKQRERDGRRVTEALYVALVHQHLEPYTMDCMPGSAPGAVPQGTTRHLAHLAHLARVAGHVFVLGDPEEG